MAEKMTDAELLQIIQQHTTDALGYGGDEITQQREMGMDYYLGCPDGMGNEVEGRSTYIDHSVQDAIEFMMPSLMRVFGSGGDICVFNPIGPEDVEMARQATIYVNNVIMQQNGGFSMLQGFFRDALIEKTGILKVWWNADDSVEREEYQRLTDVDFRKLMDDDDVEVVAFSQEEEDGVELYAVEIHRHNRNGRVEIENVPNEEFLIARFSKTIAESPFVCHRVRKTITELREMGYEVEPEDLAAGASDMEEFSIARQARYRFDLSGNYGVSTGDNFYGADPSMQEFWLHENYIRCDFEGTGLAVIRKVCTVGSTILANEEVDYIPFVSVTPIPISHKWAGLSIADVMVPIQRIKSTLMRTLMDNAYAQNWGRYQVVEGMANIEDLVTQRQGSIVRVKGQGAVTPLPVAPLDSHVFGLLEYLDSIGESRTGVSKMTQGLDEKALTSHTTATAVNQVFSSAQARLELIAKNFAETGIKDLCNVVYMLLLKHMDRKHVIRLRNEWIEVDPGAWRTKTDCTVSTGIGFGNKDQQMVHLSQMIQLAAQAMSGGLNMVNEQNMYNLAKELCLAMGFNNYQEFLTDPAQTPQQPDPREQMAQAEMQLKQQELEIKAADVQLKAQKIQQEYARDAVDATLKQQEINIEREQKRGVAIG